MHKLGPADTLRCGCLTGDASAMWLSESERLQLLIKGLLDVHCLWICQEARSVLFVWLREPVPHNMAGGVEWNLLSLCWPCGVSSLLTVRYVWLLPIRWNAILVNRENWRYMPSTYPHRWPGGWRLLIRAAGPRDRWLGWSTAWRWSSIKWQTW
jgi:hypothetical protein